MSRQVLSFREELLPAAVALATDGVMHGASRIGGSLLRLPEAPAEQLVEAQLRRYLPGGSEGRRAWVVVDGSELRAFGGVLVERLTPDDVRATYMAPKSVTVPSTALHAVSGSAARDCYPLLLDEMRRLAASIGDARLFVNVLAGDTAGAALWRELGLRPSAVMARRPVGTWRSPGRPPAGVTVRVAGPDDVPALTDLVMEEHLYNGRHTSSGVSLEVPRSTAARVAEESVTGSPETHRQLVAEDPAGRIIGAISGTVNLCADDQIQRFLLPPRYGYVGLTVVTEPARGTGVGRMLIDELMGWFAGGGIETAFLHYVADNRLSSRFWPRAGFFPHIEIYGG